MPGVKVFFVIPGDSQTFAEVTMINRLKPMHARWLCHGGTAEKLAYIRYTRNQEILS